MAEFNRPPAPVKIDLSALRPERAALLDVLCPQITDELLVEIAGNDMPDYDAHLNALLRLRQSRKADDVLHWNPREALALERWRRPITIRHHLSRAFACAALLDAHFNPSERDYSMGGLSDVAAPLVASVLALGPSTVISARSAFAAFLSSLSVPWDEEPVFAGLGLLMLLSASCDGHSGLTQSLCE